MVRLLVAQTENVNPDALVKANCTVPDAPEPTSLTESGVMVSGVMADVPTTVNGALNDLLLESHL